MKNYQALLLTLTFFLLIWDGFFLDRAARKIVKWILFFFFGIFWVFSSPRLVDKLHEVLEVERVSDLAIYILFLLFFREIILIRARLRQKSSEITGLSRALAKATVSKI